MSNPRMITASDLKKMGYTLIVSSLGILLLGAICIRGAYRDGHEAGVTEERQRWLRIIGKDTGLPGWEGWEKEKEDVEAAKVVSKNKLHELMDKGMK